MLSPSGSEALLVQDTVSELNGFIVEIEIEPLIGGRLSKVRTADWVAVPWLPSSILTVHWTWVVGVNPCCARLSVGPVPKTF